MKTYSIINAPILKQATSALAVCALLAGGVGLANSNAFVGAAWAQDDAEGPKKDDAPGNQGGQGEGAKGSQSGQDSQGGSGSGQGGPGEDSDGKGGQAGSPSADGSGGGKPAWAQEGIPEVELGRLSVARSPDQVLDRAFDEAMAAAVATPEILDLYKQESVDDAIAYLTANWDDMVLYDSPLQNLALLKDLLDNGGATSLPGVTTDGGVLFAVFLGVASDKTVPISTATVIAISTIFDHPLEETSAASLAAAAEDVRAAVLEAHG